MLFKLHGQLVQNAHRGRQTLPYRNKYHKIFGLDIFEEEEKILPIVAFPNLGQGSQEAPLTMGQEVHLGFLGQFHQFGELESEFVPVFGQRGHGHYNPFVQYQGTLPMAEKGGPVRIFHDPIHFLPDQILDKAHPPGPAQDNDPGDVRFFGQDRPEQYDRQHQGKVWDCAKATEIRASTKWENLPSPSCSLCSLQPFYPRFPGPVQDHFQKSKVGRTSRTPETLTPKDQTEGQGVRTPRVAISSRAAALPARLAPMVDEEGP